MEKCIKFVAPVPLRLRTFASTGLYNGYVAVPPTHPLYGMSDSEDKVEQLRVHGGVTWADSFEKSKGIIAKGKDANRNSVASSIPDDWWIFGFDTLHLGDNSDDWDWEGVWSEVERLAKQLECE